MSVVSVCMVTYNHGPYIKEAIESVIMQKTDFEIELVLGEDCSNDATRSICNDYAKKYPKLIKLLPSEKNLGMMQNFVRTLNACTGKYVAMCDGDDYWIDPLKLQKQVDYLEKNPDCSLCFHASKHVKASDLQICSIRRPESISLDNKFDMKCIILHGNSFIASSSMLFVNKLVQEDLDWMNKAPVGDIPLKLLLASKGRVGYIDEVMSVYRKNVPKSWSSGMKGWEKRKRHYHAIRNVWDEFDKFTGGKYHRIFVWLKLKHSWQYTKFYLKDLFNKHLGDRAVLSVL